MKFTNNKQRVCLQIGQFFIAYFWRGTPFSKKRKFYILLMTKPKRFFWMVPFRFI